MPTMIRMIAIRSNIKPALTISMIRRELLPKTMALGGVAIGIMKAIDAAIVTGTIRSKGGMWEVWAIPATMGKAISVVAVLEVNSVRNDIPVVSTAIKPRGLQVLF